VDAPGSLFGNPHALMEFGIGYLGVESDPRISIAASPIVSMIDDIELAAVATRALADSALDEREYAREDDWIGSFRRLLDNEAQHRARGGDDLYEAMVKMQRFYAQHAFLGSSAISIPVLGWLYGRQRALHAATARSVAFSHKGD
jgi:hypothetical protein